MKYLKKSKKKNLNRRQKKFERKLKGIIVPYDNDYRLWQRYNNKSQQKPSQPTLKRHFLYQQKGRFFHGSTGKGVVSIKN